MFTERGSRATILALILALGRLMASENDDNEVADASEGATWLTALENFDWLQIPGAVRAIAKVVTGTADAATAWIDVVKAKGEQKARGVRDVTGARSKTTQALTRAVSAKVAADPELLDRAMTTLVVEQLQKQKNREAVARETVSLLNEQGASAGAAEPDEDWLNTFAGFAERASSERMQKHWASVLAGEIRKRGSFSLTTLQLLSVVDAELAQIITNSRKWIINDLFIPLLGDLTKGDKYTQLMKLDAIGFLRIGSGQFFEPNRAAEMRIANKQLVFITPAHETVLNTATLTPAGQEVLQLVERGEVERVVLDALAGWLQGAGCSSIAVVDV